MLDDRSDWNHSRTVSGTPRQWNTLLREISGFSVGKAEESSCEVQELGSERVIVEVCGERVHDGAAVALNPVGRVNVTGWRLTSAAAHAPDMLAP